MSRRRIITGLLAAALVTTGLAACGSDDKKSSGQLLIGASPVPHAEILTFVKDNLAEKNGLKITIKEFTDYVQPNVALDAGDIQANFFQHKPYLDDFSAKRGVKLASAGAVHIEPLGAYSKKVKSLTELPEGATVAIPADATNGGRALKLLAANKLVTLKEGASTEKDIAENPKKLKFKAIEAAQLPRSLDDVDLAVINGNYAIEAKLKPSKDALALESGKDNPYANLLVVKQGKENDPAIQKLVKLLQSPETKKFIEDKYAGSVIPAF
ncbi:MetQ/NlpA family ABC transporter substrate-binding protein [Longispora albida]|uniref:MetQ/NlpA family ABC transporter substrate-binding protein n=1 Tax=Longispora albida TaxID=203523 RepID=UPI00036D8CD4|nr:MetQ/NlpA family ABC transporter substrate-binding protein [Longispora albida]